MTFADNQSHAAVKVPNLVSKHLPNFAQLSATLLITLAATPNSLGEIRVEKIGDPAFEIADQITFSTPFRATSRARTELLFKDLLGPSYLADSGTDWSIDRFIDVSILEPLGTATDQHLRERVAASGFINTDAFSVEEIFWDGGSRIDFLVLSPTDNAPSGASPQSPDGPVISNDIFPLTQTGNQLYQHGVQVYSGHTKTIESLDSYGAVTDEGGYETDFTGLNYGDLIIPGARGAGRGHSLSSLVGTYEAQSSITDKNGNGWRIIESYEAVRHPTDILGDLNYNGRFDVQDYNILQQNVEVAPAEPHGEFLRRLDLNGDSLVNAEDSSHLASLFPVTEMTSLTVGETYSQAFDSLGVDGTAGGELPIGWAVSDRFGGPTIKETNAAFPTSRRDLWSVDAPHALNVGLPEGEGMQDRSLAIYKPRNTTGTSTIQLLADTDTDANALKIDFAVEAWDRISTTSGNRDSGEAAFNVSVEIDSGDGTSDLSKILGGEFKELVNLGIVTTGAELQRPDGDYLDGNDPAHRVSFTSDSLHADIPAGSRLRFRWETTGEADAGEEWIFGIDDVSITLAAAGDTNFDGEVKFDDFLVLAENFGDAGGWEQGDFSGDGQIRFQDFLSLAENFGGAANASAAAVPEPRGISIALFGLLGLIGFRKRR